MDGELVRWSSCRVTMKISECAEVESVYTRSVNGIQIVGLALFTWDIVPIANGTQMAFTPPRAVYYPTFPDVW